MKPSALRILFVCVGNVCRSPMAEVILRSKLADRHLLRQVWVGSAGTHPAQPGAAPDAPSQTHARRRGYELSACRARAVQAEDYQQSDWLLCMDWDSRALLELDCPASCQPKIRGLAEFLSSTAHPVIPDPWQGDTDFDTVLDLIEEACDGLIRRIEPTLKHHA